MMRQNQNHHAEDRSCLFGKLAESSCEHNLASASTTATANNNNNCYKIISQTRVQPRETSRGSLMTRYQTLVSSLTRRFRQQRYPARAMLIGLVAAATAASLMCAELAAALPSSAASQAGQQLPAQARVGGLEPTDYIDEAGELEIMANQQQIPTAQLMSAAGHLVPDNFFLPGGSVPAIHSRYNAAIAALLAQHQQQAASKQQQDQEPIQVAASHVHARHVLAPARGSARQPLDLLVAAAAEQQQQQNADQVAAAAGALIDFNGYNLAASPDGRDGPAQMDLGEFLSAPQQQHQSQQQALYEQQLAAAQQQASHDQQLEQLAALASGQHQSVADLHSAAANGEQQQQPSADHYMASPIGQVGPDYQVEAGQEYPTGYGNEQQQQQPQQQQPGKPAGDKQRPYGLPTKSSSKEPSGMLKPLGNPKTVSSPAIDFVANLPKTSTLEKLAEKLPAPQTPTLFSFSSSKDPMNAVKGANQKKRNLMRQAEQMAKLLVKSINDKFGTNLGDQSDIPFLLSSIGPLGMAQNLLLDPTLLVTLLNSAEKTYFSDVLPGPAKSAIRPVLNLFRVPNKKRDKANLLNIISYLTSGGQTGATPPSKHRQSFGIEKSANKNNKNKDRR